MQQIAAYPNLEMYVLFGVQPYLANCVFCEDRVALQTILQVGAAAMRYMLHLSAPPFQLKSRLRCLTTEEDKGHVQN